MLSSYNGQKYIREQLDSLYRQKNVDIHILVRDDGSSDRTIEILKEYQRNYGKMTIKEEVNLGPAMSFHTLMAYASSEFQAYDYYAFCDQDDVWLDEKLSSAIKLLIAKKCDLYYSNAIITDSDLNRIKISKCYSNLSLQYVMFRQPALGCTQVMTKRFLKFCVEVFRKYVIMTPKYIELHDVWTMWISQLVDFKVVADETPHILYRKHGNNVTIHQRDNLLRKTVRVLKRKKEHKGSTFTNFKILYELLQSQLTSPARECLCRVMRYKQSVCSTISFAFYMQKYFAHFSIKVMVIYTILNRFY